MGALLYVCFMQYTIYLVIYKVMTDSCASDLNFPCDYIDIVYMYTVI